MPTGHKPTKIHATATICRWSSESKQRTLRSCPRKECSSVSEKRNWSHCHAWKTNAETDGVKQKLTTSEIGVPARKPLIRLLRQVCDKCAAWPVRTSTTYRLRRCESL
eukprot:7377269-Prymnesium_polylepis.1